ncbi:unnamed protein product [Periconia digitata]|uniref:Required for respiratory growth protein 9, mitochondrial n=1 Tax=Periconia digitata TaxID=1303443 RepID=A0A9W4UMQ7_9PLEO|nr:unnamed protein product [Periconia digitata]
MNCLTYFKGLNLFCRSIHSVQRTVTLIKPITPALLPSRSYSAVPPDEHVPDEKPAWLRQKLALKEKLGGEAWNPRKKLSPDTQEGIRHLHATQPDKFTLPVLAEHFKISKDAIRRILKSKWRPSDEEQEDRMRRWDKRGEKIWSNLVELGVKPPKKWREMGVGRATRGAKPRWKTGERNSVPVNDSVADPYQDFEDILPIVDGKAENNRKPQDNMTLEERLGL